MRTKGNQIEISIDGGKFYTLLLPNGTEDYIQRMILKSSRPYEEPLLKFLANFLDKDSIFLDIGANIGNHSLYLAATTNCGVIAVEPQRSLIDSLENSFQLNNLRSKLEVFDCGVGSKPEFATMITPKRTNLGHTFLTPDDRGQVRIDTIDNLVGGKNVRAVKIDIEGGELGALHGAVKLIQQNKPIIAVEAITREQFDLIATFLSEFNYAPVIRFGWTPTFVFVPIGRELSNLGHAITRSFSEREWEDNGRRSRFIKFLLGIVSLFSHK